MKALFASLMLAVSLMAGVNAGDPFPALTLPDQFEKEQTVSTEDRMVLISFERSVSGAFNDFMAEQPEGLLAAHHARYVADISAMPSLITKLFALPKMKKYRFPIMLNRDEAFAERFDRAEGKLTLYRLNGGKVTSVEFIAPEALGTLFGQ